MNAKTLLRNILIFSIVLCNIGCDQVTKESVRNSIAAGEIINVIDNHLVLTRVENTGAFLSLGDDLSKPARNILLSLLPILALCFGLFYVIRERKLNGINLWALCFIIGGGIGNIFDRIVFGSVTDFLHIDLGFFTTGIFNMADVSITTCALILLANTLYKNYKNRMLT
jgi:signal peptidase II